MNIYRIHTEEFGYGATNAVVVLAEDIDDAIDYAFTHHFTGYETVFGRREYRAKLVGVADPEFTTDVDVHWTQLDARTVLEA